MQNPIFFWYERVIIDPAREDPDVAPQVNIGMMKFVTSDSTTDLPLRHGEQYDNCSEQLLIEPDTTPLAALDPAILSCGLPAIVLDDEDSMRMTVPCAAAIIRYTVAQLLAFRKSPFSHRRPAAIDDPQTVHYPIWRRSGFERSRRASSGDEEQYLLYGGGSGRKPNDRQRDNGFNPPRFRRNHEFSNRNHHVIVKSYSAGDGYGHNMRLQDTIIEEEPEWVSAGPTSRLDTIELRGFDEDLSRNVTESLKSSPPAGHAKRSGAFYDELLHYEHVHPKQGAKGQHDTSGGADGESVVSTSNNGSPPPARSTPTKHVDMNNNNSGGRKGCPVSDGKGPGCSSSSTATGSSAGVNVSNFEEFMKFESMLGDLVEGNGSRFSKYFRRVGPAGGGAGSGSTGGHNHSQHAHHLNQHQQQQHHVRFALDRNTHHYQHQQPHRQAGSGRLSLSAMQHPPVGLERSTQQQPPQSYDSGSSSGASSSAAAVNAAAAAGDAKSFQRLLEMMAAQNQRMQQQQQQHYLLQLLQNSQQTEALRQVLMKKCSLEGGQQRVPTQAELQLHTQTIMKQALLRKKIAEQSRLILEQEPIPAVQQLIQSICPNVQRSLSVLGDTSGQSQQQPQQQQQQHGTSAAGCHFGPEGRNGNAPGANGSLYAGGNRAQSRSASSNRRY